MGIRKNPVTQDFEPWTPKYFPIRYNPLSFMSPAAKMLFMECFTLFVALLMFTDSAWALSGSELDALVPKIIAAESSGNDRAVGPSGERGLMQIQKGTWRVLSSYPWDDAFDGEKNVQVGRHLLEEINEVYLEHGIQADAARIIYSYNTGHYAFGKKLPTWTKKHPNKIYREIFNAK